MQKISKLLFFAFLGLFSLVFLLHGAETTPPLSGKNIESLEQKPTDELQWENNPFVQPIEELSIADLQLVAIVYGTKNASALISGEVLKKGDKLGQTEVLEIQKNTVILRNENGIFSLFLGGSSKQETENDENYSVEIREASLPEITRMLVKMDEKNVVLPNDLKGTVTASFDSISLSDALASILETNNLGMIVKNNVVQIVTRATLEATGHDLTTQTFQLKYAKARTVSEQIAAMISPRGALMLDERLNAITVRDTPVHIEGISSLLSNIDKRDRQVLIEAKIVEASLSFSRNLGIQWGVTDTTGKVQFTGLQSVGTSDASRSLMFDSPAGSPTFGGALALGSFSQTLTDIQLSAAESKGDVSILSRPSIVTMNNQVATIHSGVSFYIKTSGDVTIGSGSSGTTTGSSSNLQQIDAGITLQVTPQITADNKVGLSIDVTESQPDFTQAVDGIPAIVDNNAKTTVLLKDGETTVIGGLFQLKGTKNRSGIPGLQRIPLFGALFRSTSKTKNKSELLIFIKPTIVQESAIKTLPKYDQEDTHFLDLNQKKEKKKSRKDYKSLSQKR